MHYCFPESNNMNRSRQSIHPTEALSRLSIAMENQLEDKRIVPSSKSNELAIETTTAALEKAKNNIEHTAIDGAIEQPPSTLAGTLIFESRAATVTPSPPINVPTIASDIEHMESQRASPMPDLSVSPLTASSFHVMEREYTRDTWRMYNRIANANHREYRHCQIKDVAQSLPTDNAFLASQIDRDQQNRSMPPPEVADTWGHYVEAEGFESLVPEESDPLRAVEGSEQDLEQDLFNLEL